MQRGLSPFQLALSVKNKCILNQLISEHVFIANNWLLMTLVDASIRIVGSDGVAVSNSGRRTSQSAGAYARPGSSTTNWPGRLSSVSHPMIWAAPEAQPIPIRHMRLDAAPKRKREARLHEANGFQSRFFQLGGPIRWQAGGVYEPTRLGFPLSKRLAVI